MISWASITNKGERSHNEDSICQAEKNGKYCFVIEDGLGGHGKGEVASKLAVDTVLRDFDAQYEKYTFLESTFAHVQQVLLEEQEKNNCKDAMKTTLVCMVLDGDEIRWAHCGDSRLYFFSKKKMKLRTLDHSVPQMLVLSNQLKEKDIRFHEDRNRLLRVMGMDTDKKLVTVGKTLNAAYRQQFLLCSDGFWEYVTEKEMEKLMKKSNSVQDWINRLTDTVVANGTGNGMDNYSAISIWID